MRLWNLNDRHESIEAHRFDVMDISFSPNGSLLATIDSDGNTIIRSTKVRGLKSSLYPYNLKNSYQQDWRKMYETRTQPTQWKKSLSWNSSSNKLAVVTISNEVEKHAINKRCYLGETKLPLHIRFL